MLKVTIELWPHGSPEYKKLLHTIDIANDGEGTIERGSYKVRWKPKKEWEEKVVTNWPRNSYTAEKLLYEILKKKYDRKA